jgi:hypothetical protein
VLCDCASWATRKPDADGKEISSRALDRKEARHGLEGSPALSRDWEEARHGLRGSLRAVNLLFRLALNVQRAHGD